MARRHTHRNETEINITPMLDVVFILLIFFIVTTSFTRETGVRVLRPTASESAEIPNGTILIGITPNDEIWMEKHRIGLKDVRQWVERAHSENPEGSVIVVADRKSRIGTVTRVMDQVRLAGVRGVALSAERPGD